MVDSSASIAVAPDVDPAPGWARVAIVVLLFLPAGLAMHSLRGKSLTWDEPIYLAAGHHLVHTRNFHIAALTYHPPLALYLNSLGLLPLGLSADLFPPEGPAFDWQMGLRVTHEGGHAPALVRTLARVPFVCLFPVLGALVYAWSRSLWGWQGGLLSLWLVAWSPTLLAHARLVATDFVFTVMLVATLWAGRSLLRAGGWRRYLRACVLAGLTCLTKFSAVVLGPLAFVAGWFALRPASEAGWKAWPPKTVLYASAGLVGIVVLVIWIGYLGQFDVALTNVQRKQEMQALTPPDGLLARTMFQLYQSDLKLPAVTYLTGFISQYLHGTIGHPSYLLGEVRWEGRWYYFPIAVAVKTPLPVLVLWLTGAVAWIVSRHQGREALWLVICPLILLLLAGRTNINIGIRHLLPMYPLAAVAAGATVRWRTKWGATALMFVAAAWLAAETLRIHPHYLTYFNQLGGGPDGGRHILVDSNLDWGQDLDVLYARAQHEGWLPMQVQYFGPSAALAYAPPGITPLADPCAPTPGYVAVSVTNLMGVHVPGGTACMRWLDAYEPVARINHTIWVYRIPDDP